MKKLIILLLSIIILMGCTDKELKEKYNDTKNSIESYQLDLRIYGSFDNKKVNKIYKIDNYKNQKYKIDTINVIYYFVDGRLFEEQIDENSKYKESSENIFYDTDLILQGLNNITSKKEVENDIDGKELKVYEIKLKDEYIEELLNKLGYTNNFKEVSGKVYLENENIFKICYKIDNLNIDGAFFRINSIKDFNIDVKTNINI